MDADFTRDNLENDIPAADLESLWETHILASDAWHKKIKIKIFAAIIAQSAIWHGCFSNHAKSHIFICGYPF